MDSTVRLTDILSGRLIEVDSLSIKLQNDLAISKETEGRISLARLIENKELIERDLASGSRDDIYLLCRVFLGNREYELVTQAAVQCPRLYG